MNDFTSEGNQFMRNLMMKVSGMKKVEYLDEETTRMIERVVVVRIATKHINLWMRQLEMKRREVRELVGLLKFEGVKDEIGKEKSLETWARRCTNNFTKKR